MDLEQAAQTNMASLAVNDYPGRGIVVGLTPDATRYAQVYWIMGRSENSRNRVFVNDGGVVRTRPFDESRVEDPSLIIYNCTGRVGRCHVVTNGDQTDTICAALEAGGSFESALATRTFEPDPPNYTPRISAVVDLDDPVHAYRLAILKCLDGAGQAAARQFFYYAKGVPGIGHCITTYAGNGRPLPPFRGEPYPVEILDDMDVLADLYWAELNDDKKVALFVQLIDIESGNAEVRIINKHGRG